MWSKIIYREFDLIVRNCASMRKEKKKKERIYSTQLSLSWLVNFRSIECFKVMLLAPHRIIDQ